MSVKDALAAKIFEIKTKEEFDNLALAVFRYQASENPLYKEYISLVKIDPQAVHSILQIPFMPIGFFKSHKILTGKEITDFYFSSSGTTANLQSKHYVVDQGLYEKSFRTAFYHFYGAIENISLLALLPSYLERDGSSLVYMVADLIAQSRQEASGFYLNNLEALAFKLETLKNENKKILLIGVSFALMDLAAKFPIKIPNAIVMETGGMKGKRKEMLRAELHATLCAAFGVEKIHSEYGMTELLSQAYSIGDGIFACPPWMRVLLRDTRDPLTLLPEDTKQSGGINVIDLANLNSCSFIATDDLGKLHKEATFEVLGRFDSSDLRGCNLLVD
jgi:hypothetical protein